MEMIIRKFERSEINLTDQEVMDTHKGSESIMYEMFCRKSYKELIRKEAETWEWFVKERLAEKYGWTLEYIDDLSIHTANILFERMNINKEMRNKDSERREQEREAKVQLRRMKHGG